MNENIFDSKIFLRVMALSYRDNSRHQAFQLFKNPTPPSPRNITKKKMKTTNEMYLEENPNSANTIMNAFSTGSDASNNECNTSKYILYKMPQHTKIIFV